MYRKPFKPPRPLVASGSGSTQPTKPRPVVRLSAPPPRVSSPASLALPVTAAKRSADETESGTTSYIVQWRKKTTKKNKTWDGDGIITFDGTTVKFKCDFSGNEKYKVVGSIVRKSIDGVISIGNYELEVDCEVGDKEKTKEPEHKRKPPSDANSFTSNVVTQKFKKVAPSSNTTTKLVANATSNLDAFVMKATEDAVCDVVIDPSLVSFLRPHQKVGVAFLYECVMGLRRFKGNGALLADEMGLGKTLMTITLIYTLLRQSPSGNGGTCNKVLIVCPVTLIGNWKKEFKKWLGVHKVSVLAINNKQSTAKDKQDIKNFGKTRVYNAMILSYEKLLSCQEELKGIHFDLLVCDEGHRLKNSVNKAVKVMNDLGISKKVLLTGTPMQNDLVEFYNICNFINPGILGSFALFQKNFLKPIQRLREVNCVNKDTIRIGNAKSRELMELTQDFTLRRTSGILSSYLTPKTDLIVFCPPTEQQKYLFQFLSNTQKFKKLILSSSSNDSLLMINLFKKICNSPFLLSNDKSFQTIREELKDYKLGSALDKSSGKILTLIPLLIEIRNNNEEKVVIISNYTQTLDLLEEIIRKLNMLFLRLDGSTPNTVRDKLVVDFNKSPVSANTVFLLSAKSGGVGLNLIGASRLILFDNDWNPAIDLQAMARIHRDGQKKPVFIYRLMTTGCIDEKIFQRQLMKNSLSDKFVDNKNGSNSDIFDIQDLKDLFTLHTETSSNTHDLLDCDCEGVGEDLLLEVSQATVEEEIGYIHDESGRGWMSALDYKQIDQKEIKKKATIRSALLEYNHYQTSHYDNNCGDSLIYNVLKSSPNNPISYIFSKYTTNKLDISNEDGCEGNSELLLTN